MKLQQYYFEEREGQGGFFVRSQHSLTILQDDIKIGFINMLLEGESV